MPFARRRFVGRGARRKTLWLELAQQTAVIVLPQNTISIHASLNAAALALRPFTVIRHVGALWVASDQEAGSEAPFGAIGEVVANDQAVTAGAASVPPPYTNSGADWAFWLPFMGSLRFADATGFVAPDYQYYSYDQKGQRKVDLGQDLVHMIQNNAATHGMRYIWSFRTLIKLH